MAAGPTVKTCEWENNQGSREAVGVVGQRGNDGMGPTELGGGQVNVEV